MRPDEISARLARVEIRVGMCSAATQRDRTLEKIAMVELIGLFELIDSHGMRAFSPF
jgi:hypothetical protein